MCQSHVCYLLSQFYRKKCSLLINVVFICIAVFHRNSERQTSPLCVVFRTEPDMFTLWLVGKILQKMAFPPVKAHICASGLNLV